MKKILALLLVLLMLVPAFASCGDSTTEANPETTVETETETAAPTEETVPVTESETQTPVDPEKVTVTMDRDKLYEIKTTSGERLEWYYTYIQEAKDWAGTVWSIDTVTKANGDVVSVFYCGDGLKEILEVDKSVPGGSCKIGTYSHAAIGQKQSFFIRDNGNGSYKIACTIAPKFGINLKDGKLTIQNLEDCSDFTITETPNVNDGTLYKQWTSEKGNIYLRLPSDVVDQVYNRVKRDYEGKEDEESLKKRIDARMQLFADDVQKCYDCYIDLTAYTPYPRIIVHAFDHQGVMAGVCGNDCNIYVNVDWYVDDIEKMWKRWENGQEDYNFCVFHEMGHMFDWDRGWTFESEMQADLKATYVLYCHQNDEFGAWAAPAEYAWNNVWNIETIDTKGYHGLSGNMTYRESGEEITYKYNIYRSAEMYTAYIKYCEATDGLRGYEALKDTFHWFQENKYTSASFTSGERFEKFNEKLTEYTGMDIDEFMEDYCNKTHSKGDWKATWANANGLPALK